MNQGETDIALNDYLTQYLLRYFRNAVSISTSKPNTRENEDIELLMLHWAISEPVRKLSAYISERRHEIQAVLGKRKQEDDARIRGRFDARATAIRRLETGHPTLTVFHEAVRHFDSGPNHVLTWVLEQAWRLAGMFHRMLPSGASYLEQVEVSTNELEVIRRYDAIHQAAKQINLSRRPSGAALKEACRSRRQIYVLAYEAYTALKDIEAGDEDAIRNLLVDTLLGPLQVWQRFELAVGLGISRALSSALDSPVRLGFLAGGGDPISRVDRYEIYWQIRTDSYTRPFREPSEKIVARLLQQYGLSEGSDRPDLVVLDRESRKAVAIVEVKYFANEENDGAEALRTAIEQLVRYARGYSSMEEIDDLLDHSIVALIRNDDGRMPNPKPVGLPLVTDFVEITGNQLNSWAGRFVAQRNGGCTAFGQVGLISGFLLFLNP